MADQIDSTLIKKQAFVKDFPVYYGWMIMAAGTLGMIMTSPGQTYTESIFIESLITDLSFSRSMVSTLYSIGTLVGGFSLPYWGRQVDRHGTRTMVTVVSILFGLSLVYMGFVQNPLMVGLGFVLIRMLGQGSLGLISQTAVNQWWVRKRGLIMGLSGLLMALIGMGGFPSLVHWLILVLDWRAAYIILGLGLLLIMAPVGYLFFRNRPEDYQLQPDGIVRDQPETAQHMPEAYPVEIDWTLKEALHTRAFWFFGFSLSFYVLAVTGLTFHIVSIFQTQGLDSSLAASVFLPIALTAALSNMLVGYLSDRVPLQILLSVGLLLLAAALATAQWLAGVGSVLVFGIVFGISNGFARTLGSVVWPAFYGRLHLGSIYGFTAVLTVVGAAIGPLPFGVVYDMIGSYKPVLWITAIISMVLGLGSLLIRKPQKS
ncbi:MAG: MFS transporter [Brevefilum sp.]|nr:MFS transporter [Brevefilum sp.]